MDTTTTLYECDGWTIVDDRDAGTMYAVHADTGGLHNVEVRDMRRVCVAHGDDARQMMGAADTPDDIRYYDNSGGGCELGTLHAYRDEEIWTCIESVDELLDDGHDELIEMGLVERDAVARAIVAARIDTGDLRVYGAIHGVPGSHPLGALMI